MAYSKEEDERVDRLIAATKAVITRACQEHRNAKGKKKKEALGLVVTNLEAVMEEVREIWDLGFKKESEWTEPSLATGTDFKWEAARNRRGDVLVTAKLEAGILLIQ